MSHMLIDCIWVKTHIDKLAYIIVIANRLNIIDDFIFMLSEFDKFVLGLHINITMLSSCIVDRDTSVCLIWHMSTFCSHDHCIHRITSGKEHPLLNKQWLSVSRLLKIIYETLNSYILAIIEKLQFTTIFMLYSMLTISISINLSISQSEQEQP